MQPPFAIEVNDLTKMYGDHAALRDMTLRVRWGEIYGFLGPNGAGKSTLIQILTTLMLPTAGSARVAGCDVVHEAAKIRFKIGVALQDTGVDPLLTGRELLIVQGRLFGLNRANAKGRASELLQQFGLREVAGDRVKTYSGGMRRRLDLALALVHQPAILFLDEPTTGLDPANRIALWSLLRTIARDTQTTIFLSTQYLEEADALCDQIAIIDHGQMIAQDSPQALKRLMKRDVIELEPESETDLEQSLALLTPDYPDLTVDRGVIRVYVPHGADAITAVIERLRASHLTLATLKVTPPTLDDVFMQLTGVHDERRSVQSGEEAQSS